MVLSHKFNDSFKTVPATDLMLGVYFSSNYGNNAFDFAQAARIAPPVNDHAEVMTEAQRRAQYKL